VHYQKEKHVIQIGAPSATVDTPLEHLSACHRRIEQRLDTLVRAGDYLATDRTRALDAIAKSLEFLDLSGSLHTEDEERSVFPRLRAKLSSGEIAYLDALEDQHQSAESLLARLKQLVAALNAGYSSVRVEEYRACAEALRALYREHIRSEDEILIALAKQVLSDSETAEISKEMRERRR
jgi:hemerythrin-like domain-containing protein